MSHKLSKLLILIYLLQIPACIAEGNKWKALYWLGAMILNIGIMCM